MSLLGNTCVQLHQLLEEKRKSEQYYCSYLTDHFPLFVLISFDELGLTFLCSGCLFSHAYHITSPFCLPWPPPPSSYQYYFFLLISSIETRLNCSSSSCHHQHYDHPPPHLELILQHFHCHLHFHYHHLQEH